MARGFRRDHGGIFGLLDFLGKHAEAVEYDLLMMGKHIDQLGTPALSWRDLLVLVHRWLKVNSSATFESANGVVWSIEGQLLAAVIDLTQSANWQRAGKKSAPKPKPLPRPWLQPKTQSIGRDPIPISQFNDWWDKPRK